MPWALPLVPFAFDLLPVMVATERRGPYKHPSKTWVSGIHNSRQRFCVGQQISDEDRYYHVIHDLCYNPLTSEQAGLAVKTRVNIPSRETRSLRHLVEMGDADPT